MSDPARPASVDPVPPADVQARVEAKLKSITPYTTYHHAKGDLRVYLDRDVRLLLLAAEQERENAECERWTCFHCGETFTTYGAARDHFGAGLEAEAGCLIDRVAIEEGGKPERGRGLLIALRTAEDEIHRLHCANELLDHEACCYHTLSSEVDRLTKGHGLRMELDYRDGEKIVLQERIAQLEALLLAAETQQQAPETP